MATKETQNRTYEFIKAHKNDSDEKQQAQMFVRDFLTIFDVDTSIINSGFEHPVKIAGVPKYIDHLLSGVMLTEMKSRGISFDKIEAGHDTSPESQAKRYVQHLPKEDAPNYIMLSNFERIRLYDLMDNKQFDFLLTDLPRYLDNFSFLQGKKDVNVSTNNNIDPVNEKAATLLEALHSQLLEANYPRNYADLLMTRIVFCLFADDTQIFKANLFDEYLHETKEDGSDIVDKLASLFETLDTPESERYQQGILAEFPYINGGLFREQQKTGIPLSTKIRQNLLKVSELDWSKISPVIFGSMFEGAMDKGKRHSLGAHYTSEKNILKVVDSLFMDDLRAELAETFQAKRSKKEKLEAFHNKLANLKFLDPACGSGNFLIVAYRELRRLEHEVIDEELKEIGRVLNISEYVKVEVAQFYGIEIVPYATSIARLSLWLMDHLMNLEASHRFGQYFTRLPLHSGGNIACADALKVDWIEVFNVEGFIPIKQAENLSYILGNPPFIGSRVATTEQKNTLAEVTKKYTKSKNMDFVAGWYFKAAELMAKFPELQAALVSTNSVSQGVQAMDIWQPLFEKLNVRINFTHQTFKWDNNGAAVFVAIIGFATFDKTVKSIFSYADIKGEAVRNDVNNINQYLVSADSVFIEKSSHQISNQPSMTFGTMPIDGGNYILTGDEASNLLKEYPELTAYVKLFMGAQEMLHNEKRYILYLKNAPLKILQIPEIKSRITTVKQLREAGGDTAKGLADTPTWFNNDQYTVTPVLLIPGVSSENREYVPIGYMDENTIISNSAFQLENATLDLFALLQSKLHMAWLDTVGGRLKGDYRYSNTLVYNTFVVPTLSEQDKEKLVQSAQNILAVREIYTKQGNSLADMYDPLLMPADLRKAHNTNDKLVDNLYGLKNPTKEERVAELMKRYVEAKSLSPKTKKGK